MDDEEAFGLLGCLDVVVLAFGRRDDPAVNLEWFPLKQRTVTGLELLRLRRIEGEVGQVFRRFDVVLVAIGPVQIDLRPS